jgi:hypothetical protein
MDADADLLYSVETDVPRNWIPFLPATSATAKSRAVELRKGAMLEGNGAKIVSRGVLLRGDEPLSIRDEEVPREGIRVTRVPRLARRADGSIARWVRGA